MRRLNLLTALRLAQDVGDAYDTEITRLEWQMKLQDEEDRET